MSSLSYTYPPSTSAAITFPPPPPTSNTLSSYERSTLVRSSKKLGRILGDVPRFVDQDHTVSPPLSRRPSTSSGLPELTRTSTTSTTASFASTASKTDAESTWGKRKPTHLPPLLKLSGGVAIDSSSPTMHHLPTRRASVLSVAPSILSNAPSTASGSSSSDAPLESSQRRTKLERLRRKLGDDVPASAVFPPSPRTPRGRPPAHTHARSRSAHVRADDARSVAFSVSSDESMHTITLHATTTRGLQGSSSRPPKTRHAYHARGALPPVPPLPTHLSARQAADEDAGLVRARQKLGAGSRIGGADFKAARRAMREGRALTGQADVGELIEMVGFMGSGF
ncbi:hypothetical protein BU15DRAFT_75416 [Melanogaster broomeanus]|nr:hypothetical protein BU15DRAFT_75416 [Melanogaster broomeanus]